MRTVKLAIESGIPIPPRGTSAKSDRKQSSVRYEYQWDKLKVGNSVFVPLIAGRGIRQQHMNVISAAMQAASRRDKGERYVTRVSRKNGQEGIRVWRVE